MYSGPSHTKNVSRQSIGSPRGDSLAAEATTYASRTIPHSATGTSWSGYQVPKRARAARIGPRKAASSAVTTATPEPSLTYTADTENDTSLGLKPDGSGSPPAKSWIRSFMATLGGFGSLSEDELPFHETHDEAFENFQRDLTSGNRTAGQEKVPVTEKDERVEQVQEAKGAKVESIFDEKRY